MSTYGSGYGNNSRKKVPHELLIKATSRSLFLHNPTPKFLFTASKDRSKSASRIDFTESDSDSMSRVSEDVLSKDKKSSSRLKWKKPLKALSHLGQQRFNCSFFLHVRSIEGLPSSFDGISLCVHWKRKDKVLQTCLTRVIRGTADFDETLMQRCSVYVARSGHRWVKYGEKVSSVYVSVVGAPGMDIGKHQIDLTRILPITLEELTGEKSSGKWTTNLELRGRAEGAFLNVTFSFAALKGNMTSPNDSMSFSQPIDKGSGIFDRHPAVDANDSYSRLRRAGSTPSSSNRRDFRSWSNELDKNWEVMQSPDLLLAYPTDSLYRKLNEGKIAESDSLSESEAQIQGDDLNSGYVNEFDGEKCEQIKFTVAEKGIEMSKQEHHKANQDDYQITDGSTAELLEVEEISLYEDIINDEEANCNWKNVVCSDYGNREVSKCKKENDDIVNDEEANCSSKNVVCTDYKKKDMSECEKENDNISNDEEANCNLKHVICGDFENNDVSEYKETDDYIEESEIKEMEYHHRGLLKLECAEPKSPTTTDIIFEQDNYDETKSDSSAGCMNGRLLSHGNTDDLIGKNSLVLCGVDDNTIFASSEHDPESPRERLLREFEKEALASGSFILDLYAGRDPEEFTPSCRNDPCKEDISENTANISTVQGADKHEKSRKAVGDRIEPVYGIESGEQMEWIRNEKVSHSSTNCCSAERGSSTKQSESPIQPPPAGDCVGPIICTKDGGILRSMYIKPFKNVKNCAPLTIQVSRSIVLPAEMGSRIMDILQSLASVDIEKLSEQLERLLPLEDISEKSMEQISNRAVSTALERKLQAKLQNETEVHGRHSGEKKAVQYSLASQSNVTNSNSTVTNLDQQIALSQSFASMIVKRIECLLIEGLKIQSGMSDEVAPSKINPGFSKKAIPFRGRTKYFGRGNKPVGIAGLGLLITDTDDNCKLDHFFGMCLTLDKWLTSHTGIIDNDDKITEQRDMNFGCVCDRNCSFTIAVRVQLRDLSQNVELVGIPMLAFVQVESSVPLKSEISCIDAKSGSSTEIFLEEERDEKVIKEEDFPSGFKITGMNVAGLHTDDSKKKLWSTAIQQQSGAHWLLAGGIGKADKPNVISSEPMLRTHDILWSISSHTGSRESGIKDASMPISYVRNPDIILPEAGIRVHAAGFF